MCIKFNNLDNRFESGMKDFLKYHNMWDLPYDINVDITVKDGTEIRIKKEMNAVHISLGKPYQIFRALVFLKEHLNDDSFEHIEECCFEMGGPMFDGSQASSLMNVDSVKKMLLISAGMGFNMMMLYCEDCYEIEGEKYFGNMRPRYSMKDFRQLDDYAYSLGIELVPCIQTLGHLTEAIKRPPYKKISDNSSVLLVGDPDVYTLIDKMLATMSKCFRSRQIHLGLDEAFGLGLGKYLKINGYQSPTAIMKAHLYEVDKIVKKYGFKPMMWGDMFFRAHSKLETYRDPEVELGPEDRDAVPENMSLIYWDYYDDEIAHYEHFMDKFTYLSKDVIFSGCARNVRTFGSHYEKGRITTNAGMTACKNKGIKKFIVTVWGDDHRESSTFAILPQLQIFAEHMYALHPDEKLLPQRFEACTGLGWDAMMDIDAFDAIPGYTDENVGNIPVSKALMWQNVLLGLFDRNLGDIDFHKHYEGLKEKFEKSSEKYPDLTIMFQFYYHLANVLKDKAGIGIRLKEAYDNHDLNTLKELRDTTLVELLENVKNLRLAHRDYFYNEYKPIGWEVLDVRYGGAIMSIDTAIKRITDYLENKIDKIEELEEERLSFSEDGTIPTGINYVDICSASRV